MKLLKTVMISGLLSVSVSVMAHTAVKSTYPASQQMLEAAPKQLSLTFESPVRLMKVILEDGEYKDLKIGFKPSAQAKQTFNVAVPKLQVGKYIVNWVSMGRDGHKMSGYYDFMVNQPK